MKNIYYMIWSDAILSIRKHNPHKKDWKISIFIFITWMHALNFWVVLLWLKYFKVLVLPIFSVDVFPGDMIDGFLAFTIEFFVPFVVLNYFLIFRNNKYEKIIMKYGNVRNNYGSIYSITMILGAFFSAILYNILSPF